MNQIKSEKCFLSIAAPSVDPTTGELSDPVPARFA